MELFGEVLAYKTNQQSSISILTCKTVHLLYTINIK